MNGWWFYAYDKNGTHDIGDMQLMAWHDSATPLPDCHGVALPDCWVKLDSVGSSCSYFAEYVQGPAELEQSSSMLASVRGWQAPTSGVVQITTPTSNVRKTLPTQLLPGNGSWIRIYRNDLPFFEKHLDRGNTTGFPVNESIAVNAGDWLWFHNDPDGNVDNDEAVFLPSLTLSAGAGYDPDVITHQSSADFQANPQQGANGWTYESFESSTGNFVQMPPPLGTDALGRHWKQGTVNKVWKQLQHPSATHDAVRVWTAPQDGFLMLTSLSNVRKPTAGNPVAVQVRHIRPGMANVLWQENIVDTTGVPLGAIVNVRTGDRIVIHATALVPNPLSSHVLVDLQLELHPLGEIPRTFIDHGPPGDVVIASDEVWFYEDHEITGNLKLQSGRLYVLDSSVTLMNSYEKEFNYEFLGGRLTTKSTTIGGGPLTATPLHSNFEFFNQTGGQWNSEDTTVQYCYGTLLSNATLTGTGHMAGQQSDLLHMGDNAHVTLTDSTYPFRLLFPANIAGDIDVDLPIDTPITRTIGAAEVPGVTWNVNITDTTVPFWALAPYDMVSGVGVQKTVTLDNISKCFAEMSGRNLNGRARPYAGVIKNSPAQGELDHLDTFNVRWAAGVQPAEILLWAAYFDGSGADVTLLGDADTLIAELFSFDGASVEYVGTPLQKDARIMATVVRCFDSAEILLKDCELGATWTKGDITVENWSHVTIDSASVINDIALRAFNNSTIDVYGVSSADLAKFSVDNDATSSVTFH